MSTATIRELKHRYKLLLAQGRTLPTHDLAVPLPLSTGNALFDAALVDKLVTSATMNEAEHLGRAWHLARAASRLELEALARHGRSLLNDYKLLLALACWERGDAALTAGFLRALPWRQALAFPIAVVKPAAALFTGWRADLRFRLVDDPRFPALRELFRDQLAAAPPVAILKYRATVQHAAALLRYRFDGPRERAIHDVCFGRGEAAAGEPALEPVGAYVRARDGLRAGGARAMLDALGAAPEVVPLTSYMGLLGGHGLRLTDAGPHARALRDYALRCATAAEVVLRLAEWAPWLEPADAAPIAARVHADVASGRVDLSFHKAAQAFAAAPPPVRAMLLEPLYLPLLRDAGRRFAAQLPQPGPFTFLLPGAMARGISVQLQAVMASAMPTRLVLAHKDTAVEIDPVPLERLAPHLAEGPEAVDQWLLSLGGAPATEAYYVHDDAAIARAIGGLDPAAPLLLDVPVGMRSLSALMPFERVFNLGAPEGVPGELCVDYAQYTSLLFYTDRLRIRAVARQGDDAARGFSELLDRLAAFRALAAEVDAGCAPREGEA